MRVLSVVALFAAVVLGGCEAPSSSAPPEVRAELMALEIPPEHAEAEALFQTHCSACHGTRAVGTRAGPALVHQVYRPAHHADIAFKMAIENGVRAHHWRFGNMPPVRAIEADEIQPIVDYLRWLQRQAGVE